ncbi:MAG: YncE family protein [Candidatus Binatia bacterium]
MTRPVQCSALCVLAAFVLAIPRATRADMCAYAVSPGNGEDGMGAEMAVIDVMSQAKVADISIGHDPTAGVMEGYYMAAVAIDPKGQAIYVVSMGDGRTGPALSVVETTAYTVAKQIPLPHQCQTVVISSDGRFAYLTDYEGGGVDVVDLSAGEFVRWIDNGEGPEASVRIAISSDGTKLFTPRVSAGGPGGITWSVGIYDTTSGGLTDTVAFPSSLASDTEPLTVLLSPDEQRAYVAVWPPFEGVLVLDLTSHTVVDQFENVGPFIALSPGGSHLYTFAGSALTAIDVQTKAVQTIPLGTVAVPGGPVLAATPESNLVWFPYSSFLVAVDAETQSVVAQIPVAGSPSDIAVGSIIGPCRPAAYTPQQNATPTATPTTTPTEAPTFRCPPGVPCLEISSALIPAGGEATIAVHLMTAGQQIAGIQNDISFDSPVVVHDCKVSSDLPPLVGGFYSFSSSLRALFYSPAGSGQTVISDGALLYSCTVTVASEAPLGNYLLVALNIYGSDPRGNAITVAGADGEVVVTTGRSGAAPSGVGAASTSTSSGCQVINGPAADSLWLGLVIPMLLLRRRTEKCIS